MAKTLTSTCQMAGLILFCALLARSTNAQSPVSAFDVVISARQGFLTKGDNVSTGISGAFSKALGNRFSIVAVGEFATHSQGNRSLESIYARDWVRRAHYVGDLLGQFDVISISSGDHAITASIRGGITGRRGLDRSVGGVTWFPTWEACVEEGLECAYLPYDGDPLGLLFRYDLRSETVSGLGWTASVLVSQRFFDRYLVSVQAGLRHFGEEMMWTAGVGYGLAF